MSMVDGPGGNKPWSPNQSTDPGTASPGISEPEVGLANERPVRRSNVPLKIMIGALVALLITLGGVGYLLSQQTQTAPQPAVTPLPVEPTGVPKLPIQAGEYSRDPGNAAPPPEFGVDTRIQTAAANYRRNGQPALIAVAARPAPDVEPGLTEPNALLDQINVRAVRPIGDGLCGREAGNDLDVCVLNRGETAVFVIGLRDQTVEEIMAATVLILEGTE